MKEQKNLQVEESKLARIAAVFIYEATCEVATKDCTKVIFRNLLD